MKKSHKKIAAVLSCFTFLSNIAYAEPLTVKQAEELRPALAAQLPVTSNQQPVVQIPSGSVAPETAALSALQPASITTVSKPHRKAEDTNNAKVSYNVESGKLVLYVEKSAGQYERRVVDLQDASLKSNPDIQRLVVSTDGKTAAVQIGQNLYALDIKPEDTVSSKFASLDAKTDGTVESIEINADGMINAVTTKYNHYSWARLAPARPANLIVTASNPNFAYIQGQTRDEIWIDRYEKVNGEWKLLGTYYLKSGYVKNVFFDVSSDGQKAVLSASKASGPEQNELWVMKGESVLFVYHDRGQIQSVEFKDSETVVVTDQERIRYDLVTLKEVVAEYPIAIGTGTSVKLFSDGSYELTYEGKNYKSDDNGKVSLSSTVSVKVNFQNDVLNGFTVLRNQQVSQEIKLFLRQGVYEVYEIQDWLNGKVTNELFVNHDHGVIQFVDPYGRRVAFLLTPGVNFKQLFDRPLDVFSTGNVLSLGISLNTDKIFLKYEISSGMLREISLYGPGGSIYSVWAAGAFDLNESDLLGIQDRAFSSFPKLLKDDQLIQLSSLSWTKASDGKEFVGFVARDQLVFSPARQLDKYFKVETNSNGRYVLKVPQDDGSFQIYDMKIDEQGKVSLETRFPKSFNIGDLLTDSSNAINIQVRGPKDFTMLSANGEYRSDKSGVVRESDGTRWTITLDENDNLSGVVVYSTDGRQMKVSLTKRRAVKNNVTYSYYAVSQVETFGAHSVIESRQTVNFEDKTFLDEVFCVKGDCANPSTHFVIFNSDADLSRILTFDRSIEQTPTTTRALPIEIRIEEPTFNDIFVDVNQWTDTVANQPQYHFSLKHYAEGKIYQLYETGASKSFTTFDLVQIKDRTTESLRKAIKSDRLLEQGQIITASDGTKFKLIESNSVWLDLRRLTDNGSVSMGDEVSAIWDRKGAIDYFLVRFTDGTTKKYKISFDEKGSLQLILA